MPRIIFINRYFYPDHSATSQILGDLAFHLAGLGRAVHVVTGRQHYDDPRRSLPAQERIGGVSIHRVAATSFGRASLIGRTIDYLSFYVSTWRMVLALAQPGDILIAKTDPPLLSILAARATRRRGARLINWLQDLYPEVAAQLHIPLLGGGIGRALVARRDRSLLAADANVVPGERMSERVAGRGVDPTRIAIIANWVDDERIVPVAPADNELRRAWRLEDKFVVGYSGNLGRAHEFDTLLGAAERLREHTRIVFVFIGGGKRFDELAGEVAARGLQRSFRFFPYQDRSVLKFSLSVPDLHWMSLSPGLEGLLFPSKLYGILAAGRPVIAVVAKDGEIARLVESRGCGVAIAPGDAAALAAILLQLSRDAARCAEMGRRARDLLDEQFTRRAAFAKWEALIERVGSPASPLTP